MTAPAGGQQQQDPAHAQKRSLEGSIATQLATTIVGSGAKVEFREIGRDREGAVERGEADVAMAAVDLAATNVAFSIPYAAGGVVLVVKGSSSVTDVRGLAGQTVSAALGDAGLMQIAQTYLKDTGVAATVNAGGPLTAAIAALDSGQAAAVAGDRTGIALLQRGRAEPLRILVDLAPRPYAVAVRKDATALKAAIDEALGKWLASGEIRRLSSTAGFPYEAP